MNNLGAEILRKGTPLLKSNPIKMNTPQVDDKKLGDFFVWSFFFFKAKKEVYTHIASQPRVFTPLSTKGVLIAIGIVHIPSARNCLKMRI